MKLREELAVKPGRKVRMDGFDPAGTLGLRNNASLKDRLEENLARLDELQYLLYAEGERALLVVLQGMDAAGKDGTIRHVMSGVNPQGCKVTSFREPSAEERRHDFLWRVHQAVPPRGDIGIFNRSHYEDVLIVRVHRLVPKSVWSKRYKEINTFERALSDNGVTLLKFFLNVSNKEQKKRLVRRLKDPTRFWKASPADFEERDLWDDYMKAYEDALTRCSTPWAPWFVIPSDKKWFRNFAVSQIIVETLEAMHMQFPPPAFDISKIKVR